MEWVVLFGMECGCILCCVVDIMCECNYDLLVLEIYDIGKFMFEIIVVDVISVVDVFEYFGGLVGVLIGEYILLVGGDFVYMWCEVFGVCVGIGVWNYLI